jgi:VWFA-related protein
MRNLSKRLGISDRSAILIACACLLFLIADRSALASKQAVPVAAEALAVPAKVIDLSSWGFSDLAPIERFTSHAVVTVGFLDGTHLLFTFNPKKMVHRLPGCPPTHADRIIHAVVIDVSSVTLTKETDWYVHDTRPYLWMLSPGRLLLRKLNSLYEVDSDLHEKLLLDLHDEVLWLSVTPDGKQLLVETSSDEPSATQNAADLKRGRAKVKIDFLDSGTLAVNQTMKASGIIKLDASSLGYPDATHNSASKTWLIRFGPGAKNRRYLARVKSNCSPSLLFPANNAMFIGRCSRVGTGYSVSVFTVTGHPLWRQRWEHFSYLPSLERSGDSSRFAISTFAASSESGTSVPEEEDGSGWADLEQTIRVFETATGKLILSAKAKSVVLNNPNFSLSPDGTRLALLDGTLLKIYELPPMSVEERAKYVAMIADAPSLSAPVLQSSEKESGGEPESGSLGTPDGLESSDAQLLAPLKETPTSVNSQPGSNVSQTTNPSAPPAESPGVEPVSAAGKAIRVAAEEVLVDVVVTDSKGYPAKSLSEQDFQIQEDGKTQKITAFHEFDTSTPAPLPAPLIFAPNVFTNNQPSRRDQACMLVVLDLLNTPFVDQQYARDQLLKFLRKKPKDMQFALFVLTERLRMIQGFTADENLLLATLSAKKGGTRFSSYLEPNTGLEQVVRLEKEAAVQNFGMQYTVQALQRVQLEDRVRQLDRRMALTMEAFTQLARYLSGVPGRKNLVWLSASLPAGFLSNARLNADTPNASTEVRNYQEQLSEAINLLAQTNIAVYPVDVRGLEVGSVTGASSAVDGLGSAPAGSNPQGPPGRTPSGSPFAGVNVAMSIQAPTPIQDQAEQESVSRDSGQATMDQVAEVTGGKAFYNTNGIEHAIEIAAEQASKYYTLSYVPQIEKYDGKFRKLKVLLARKGLHLAYRRGYYALDPYVPSKGSTNVPQRIGLSAMQHGVPLSRQLVFAARVVPVGSSMKKAFAQQVENSTSVNQKGGTVEVQHYAIDYAIPSQHLRFNTIGDTRRAVVDFMVSAFADEGNVVASTGVQITRDLDSANYKDAIVGGFRMHQEIDVPIRAVSLRVGVQDESTAHIGTLDLPLPLKAPPDGPALRAKAQPPIEPD